MQRRSIVSLIVSSWFITAVMISPALADDPAAPNSAATQSIPIAVPATPSAPPTNFPADAPAVTAQTAAPFAALQSTPQPSAAVIAPTSPAADPSRWDPYALPSQRPAAPPAATTTQSSPSGPITNLPAPPTTIAAAPPGTIAVPPGAAPIAATTTIQNTAPITIGWTGTSPANTVIFTAPPAAGAPITGVPAAAIITQPSGVIVQPPRTLPNMSDARPLNPTSQTDPNSDEGRPLYSVMVKSRPKASPQVAKATSSAPPTEIALASHESPVDSSTDNASTVVAPAAYDAPPPGYPTQNSPSQSFAPNNGAPYNGYPNNSANNTYPPRGFAPRANNTLAGQPTTNAGSFPLPFTAAPRTQPPDPAKIAAAHAAADLFAGAAADLQAESEIVRIPLADVLTGASPSQRVAIVTRYWQLSRAIKDYRWSQDELHRLEDVVPNRNAVDAPMLSTARAAAEARSHQAELAVVQTREALVQATPWGQSSEAAGDFRTADRPLLGPYNTYFDTLFANRPAPGRAKEIDRSLPMRLAAINDLTASVQAALGAIHTTEEAHAKGETDMRTVLACHEALHDQRRQFLDAVFDYNVEIAEYAATIASPGMTNDRFVAMLIYSKPTERIGSLPSRPANSTSGGPATFDSNRQFGIRAESEQRPANDGWMPSHMQPVEVGPPQSYNGAPQQNDSQQQPQQQFSSPPQYQPQQYQPQPQFQSQRSDPFAAPPTDNRSGQPVDRYGQPIR